MSQPRSWSKILTVLILVPYLLLICLSITLIAALIVSFQYDAAVTMSQALLIFVAAPTSIVIAFYFWKSKAENLVKIAMSLKENNIDNDIAGRIIDTDEIRGG